jgi:hypothetical protein
VDHSTLAAWKVLFPNHYQTCSAPYNWKDLLFCICEWHIIYLSTSIRSYAFAVTKPG